MNALERLRNDFSQYHLNRMKEVEALQEKLTSLAANVSALQRLANEVASRCSFLVLAVAALRKG